MPALTLAGRGSLCNLPVNLPVKHRQISATGIAGLRPRYVATKIVALKLEEFAKRILRIAKTDQNSYHPFLTVDLNPPSSELYARGSRGATLGIALLLGRALTSTRAVLLIPAALIHSLFSIPHLFFHLDHHEDGPTSEAIALTTAKAVVALLGPLVIALTVIRDRHQLAEPRVGGRVPTLIEPTAPRPAARPASGRWSAKPNVSARHDATARPMFEGAATGSAGGRFSWHVRGHDLFIGLEESCNGPRAGLQHG